ncbi:MAG: dihydrodipicolinate synthase family protein [Chloroflexi bacterium]|nr:dihydrodipicolinate synthase family protein [Chloroflexota bacterium]
MTGVRHRGLFAIPVTPFTEDGALDEASLRRVIAFCIEAGTHGIVTPVNASEFTTLTPEERRTVIRIAVEETERAGAKDRVPVVAGVCARTTPEAVEYARFAQDTGADAVISMPAYDPPLDEQGSFDFFAALAGAVDVPIYIQNHERVGGPSTPGAPMSPELLAQLCREIDDVRYIKEESLNTGQKIVRTRDLAGDACHGIMGGKAGRYVLDEYRRGACGTMPACESADVHAQIWNALDAGRHADARRLFTQLLPLLNYEAQYGTAVYKEVMYRRRIIASPYKRLTGLSLDRYDHEELDVILDELSPLFTVKTPTRRP